MRAVSAASAAVRAVLLLGAFVGRVRGGGLLHVVGCQRVVALSVVGVLGGRRMVAVLVVLGGSPMMLGCLRVVLSCFRVMLCCRVTGHDGPSHLNRRPLREHSVETAALVLPPMPTPAPGAGSSGRSSNRRPTRRAPRRSSRALDTPTRRQVLKPCLESIGFLGQPPAVPALRG